MVEREDVGLDQYYTPKDIVGQILQTIKKTALANNGSSQDVVIMEPSAGDGAFSNKFNDFFPESRHIAMDIDPRGEGIDKQNFYEYQEDFTNKKLLIIGNPPFGIQGKEAKKFINHAATLANDLYVSFVLPANSMGRNPRPRKGINKHLSIVYEKYLGKMEFNRPNQSPKKIGVCFQIWKKGNEERIDVELPLIHDDFVFLKGSTNDSNYITHEKDLPDDACMNKKQRKNGARCRCRCRYECDRKHPAPNGAEIAVRAHGNFEVLDLTTMDAEQIIECNFYVKSWHFLKCNINKDRVLNIVNNMHGLVNEEAKFTSGNQSISMGKGVFVDLYKEKKMDIETSTNELRADNESMRGGVGNPKIKITVKQK